MNKLLVKKPILGIIGGMGPLATVEFQRLIIEATPAKSDQDHIEVITHNNPHVPDRTRSLAENGGLSYVREVVKSGQKLIDAGATLLVMPCITAHARFGLIQEELSKPLLNMVEITAQEIITGEYPQPVGILATDGTINAGIINEVFSKNEIMFIRPNRESQKKIMEVIYSIKSGSRINTIALTKVVKNLKILGARSILLGCTELCLHKAVLGKNLPTINPMKILAGCLVKKIPRQFGAAR